jgi:hypothetical protein
MEIADGQLASHLLSEPSFVVARSGAPRVEKIWENSLVHFVRKDFFYKKFKKVEYVP